ncbi:MAG: RcpC/CpaB family pilus assembly protein [Elusimicrobiales bacterium]|nr:RcpC/CpaB family pilus assembly protein [Elusimicrobiales bacterium]
MTRAMIAAALLAAAGYCPGQLGATEAGKDGGVAVSSEAARRAAGTVAPGYRGTAIPVGGDQLMYVKKGDRVDVLVTFDAKMEKDVKETVTATILQNVVVLNVEKPASPEEPGVIELLLNPNEAQYAALSVAQGKKVHVTVRAPGDLELHPMEMASFRRLIK